MDCIIPTTSIVNSFKSNSLMPYFLDEPNELMFKENMKELYSQISQERPLALYFNGQEITEQTWNETKFVGSFFTSLFSHWSKILYDTQIYFVEVTPDFPEEITLDLNEQSFVLFYAPADGMISKRDECIMETDNEWISTFFDWLYNEIEEVENISGLYNKYKAFTDIFAGDELDNAEEDETFQLPEEFYDNLDNMKRSILAALEDDLNEATDIEDIKLETEKKNLIKSIKETTFIPIGFDFLWEGKPTRIDYPISIPDAVFLDTKYLDLLENKNGWLIQQSAEVKSIIVSLWVDYIYNQNVSNIKIESFALNQNSEIESHPLKTNWADFGIYLRTWLRFDSAKDAKKIERKIHATFDKIISGGKITHLSYPEEISNFIKSILYIEKMASISDNTSCVIDVENVSNQYFYALNSPNVIASIWGAIVQEKIQKQKARKTFSSQFEVLKEKFPNFKDVIDYYSGAMYIFEQTGTPPAPILLLGSPGLGKTHFASEIAKVVGAMMTVIPVSSLTAGWIISGSSASWKDAQMGKIATALLNGTSMSPVIVLDEIDKKSEGNYDPLGALYPLLEYQTAKEFVDEFLEFPLDASKVIWVATANSLNTIPEPILDRFVVFDVAKLTPIETIKVAKNIFNDLTPGLKPQDLSEEILDILKDKTPRQIKQVLKKALAYAAIQRTQDIILRKEHLDLKTKIKKIGF